MIKIKQDPLSISISLLLSLNLLEEDREYNINEIKSLSHLTHHWVTVQKYLKIFNNVHKYCPKFELNGSKLKIIESQIYRRLSKKEKLILYLYNNKAFDSDSAVNFEPSFNVVKISESIGYLYKKTNDNKFYLTKSGINKYNLITKLFVELIFNENELDEIFEPIESIEPYEANFYGFAGTKESSPVLCAVPSISECFEGTSANILPFSRERDLTTH